MMRRAGRVVAFAQGVLVLRREGDDPPDIGAPVVDQELRTLGTVVDVFGPVDRPFLAVAVEDDREATDALSQVVYLRHERER